MSLQLPNVDIRMTNRHLSQAPRFALPVGYSMRFYRAGDVPIWVQIQQSADPFFVATAETFASTLPGDTAYLAARVMFLVDPNGSEIGTITAWNDSLYENREMGHIHWVAIMRAAQGQGLAKPLLSAACELLQTYGYNEAWLETNTRRIPAINLYLAFGFRPYLHGPVEREAWQVITPLVLPVGPPQQ